VTDFERGMSFVLRGVAVALVLSAAWASSAFGEAPTYRASIGSYGSGNGQFAHPAGVAIDAEGNLWVADQGNDRVQKFNEAGEYVSKFGSSGSENGQFAGPKAIAIDAEGNIWVADSGNGRLQQFDDEGKFIQAVGSPGSGNGHFSGPEDIAIDAEGNIWVADTYNYRIQKLNDEGEFIKVVNPEGLGAIEPTGIDVGSGGKAWVTDWAHNRVAALSEAGAFVSQFGSGGSGNGKFSHPDGIDVDSKGNVWVGDEGNSRVQKFNEEGEYLDQFGSGGSGEGQFGFSYPFGIAADSGAFIWIADSSNDRVQKWSTSPIPFCYAGTASTEENEPLVLEAAALDCAGEAPLEYEIVSGPEHGEITEFDPETGALTYTPESEYTGLDSFTFKATNSKGSSAVKTFKVAVGEVAVCNDGEDTTAMGEPLVLEAAALDCAGEAPLEYEIVSGPEHGEISGFDAETGALTYTPESEYAGPDSFTFRSTNLLGPSSTQTFQITVQGPPLCNDGWASTEEDEPLVLEAGALECEGEGPLTYEIVSGPEHGEISGFDAETGALTYTPDSEFTGLDSFTFKAINGIGPSVAKTFEVAVGDPPTCEDGEAPALANQPLVLEAGTLECEGEAPLEYEIVSGPEHGEISEFNAETGALTYTPESEYTGLDSFTFKAINGLGSSGTQSFALTVQEVPLCHYGDAAIPGGEPFVLEAGTLECEGEAPLEYEIVSGPEHGEITEFDPETGALTYTPESEFTGYDSFRFRATNSVGASSTKTFEIEVGETTSGTPDFQLSFGGSGSGEGQFQHVTDVAVDEEGHVYVLDGTLYTVQKFTARGEVIDEFGGGGSGNGDLYHPSALAVDPSGNVWVADSGNDRIEKFGPGGEYLDQFGSSGGGYNGYFAYWEGHGHFNDPGGIAVDAAGNIYVSDSGNHRIQKFDDEGNFLAVHQIVGEVGPGEPDYPNPPEAGKQVPAGIGVGPNGDVWYVQNTGGTSPYGFAIRLSSELEVLGIADYYAEGALLYQPQALDVDSQGNVWVGDGGKDRVVEYSRTGKFLNAFGKWSGYPGGNFDFGSSFGHFGLDVDSHNRIWIADENNDRVQRWAEHKGQGAVCDESEAATPVDHPLHLTGTDLGCEGEAPLSYEIVSGPEHGEITEFDPETGALTYTPDSEYLGVDSFVVTATNELAVAEARTFTVKVGDLARCSPGKGSTPLKTALAIELECTGSPPLEYEIVDSPDHGVISGFNLETGHLTYTPGEEFFGIDSFKFRSLNALGPSPRRSFEIEVGEKPSCHTGGDATPVETPLFIHLVCKGSEPLEYVLNSSPEHGEISGFDPEAGTLTYTPEAEYVGLDTVRFFAYNILGDATQVTFNIDVGGQQPLALYPLDEETGTIANDVLRGHDGLISGPLWTSGVLDSSGLYFAPEEEGTVVVDDDEDFHVEDLTAEAWVRPEAPLEGAPVVAKVDSEDYGFALVVGGETPGRPAAYALSSGEPTAVAESPESLPIDEWSHLVMTSDGELLKLYVDGELVASDSTSSHELGAGDLEIGGSAELGEGAFFEGDLDQVVLYGRALSAEEIADGLDSAAPSITLGGPLLESVDGPLGVTEANLSIEADDGVGSSGLHNIEVWVDDSEAESVACPCEEGMSFTYEQETWGEGPHDIQVIATDNVGNRSERTLEIDVPDGPSLILDGPLYERRGKTVSTKSHKLMITAAQTDGSETAPRPGVQSIEVRVDGSLVGEPETQPCPEGNCPMDTTWIFDPTEYFAGNHTIKVTAKDQRENSTSRSFLVLVSPEDPCGNSAEEPNEECPPGISDIQHVETWAGNPNHSSFIAEEWIEAGTDNARRIDEFGRVTTRGQVECPGEPEALCGEVRSEDPSDFGIDYFVTTGEGASDPNLDPVADVKRFDSTDFEEPVATGDLADILASSQNPPLGHGDTYELYEDVQGVPEGPTLTTRWWVDEKSGLPVRWAFVYDNPGRPDGPVVERKVFDFDQNPPSLEELSPSLFLLPEPEELGFEFRTDTAEEPEELEINEEELP
jgi:sugar lactone lactonase YvrE